MGAFLLIYLLTGLLAITPRLGCHDGRRAEEGAGHQLSFGEDEEEPGGDSEGPAGPPG